MDNPLLCNFERAITGQIVGQLVDVVIPCDHGSLLLSGNTLVGDQLEVD